MALEHNSFKPISHTKYTYTKSKHQKINVYESLVEYKIKRNVICGHHHVNPIGWGYSI